MPIYEYRCASCGHRFEVMQRVADPAPSCEACGGAVEKLISAPAFQFKGSGWYVTDYANKGKKGDGDGKADKEKADGAGESGAKEGAKEGKADGAKKEGGGTGATSGAKSAGAGGD